jgi:small-conductance mechanosensitive channel
VNEVGEVWDDTWEFLDRHPYLEAAVIVALSYALARIVDWVLSGSLRRLVARSETEFDDRLIDILHRPVKATVLLVGLIIATNRLDLSSQIERNTVLAITTLLIIVWAIFGRRFSRLALGTMRENQERFAFVQPSTEPLLSNAAAVVFFIVAAYIILLAWDINITGLVASAGIIGLALSFAAQDTLGNLFAGIAILSDRPYTIGDFIILDTGERGQVVRIGLRSTSLLTRDDVEVSIPNGVMGASKIVNEAGGPPRLFRIRTRVTVAYGSDIDQVVETLMAVATEHSGTLAHPTPRVRFRTFGDSGLEYELLAWIARPADRGRTVHELNTEIYKRFRAAGIKIPPPQREVYLQDRRGVIGETE